jgi:hypothetical protein
MARQNKTQAPADGRKREHETECIVKYEIKPGIELTQLSPSPHDPFT